MTRLFSENKEYLRPISFQVVFIKAKVSQKSRSASNPVCLLWREKEAFPWRRMPYAQVQEYKDSAGTVASAFILVETTRFSS